jgi:hypothetical protein
MGGNTTNMFMSTLYTATRTFVDMYTGKFSHRWIKTAQCTLMQEGRDGSERRKEGKEKWQGGRKGET